MNRFAELIENLNAPRSTPRLSIATQQPSQQAVLDKARKEAQSRVQRVYLRLNGTHSRSDDMRREGLLVARRLIDHRIANIDTVVEKLDVMHTVLGAPARFTLNHDANSCQMRGAYYDHGDRLVHLCPAFFTSSDEERARLLIHESAHAAGIGQSGGESYLVVYDCQSSFDDINVADGWAHFVHCFLGLPPDPPNVIRGGSKSKSLGWSRATQVPEATVAMPDQAPVAPDKFVLDVLEFFFDERLQEHQLNDELREIAARMLWTATEATGQMDLIPRPPSGVPSITWLVSQAVQIAYRRATNRGIYEAVRVVTARNFRSACEIAKLTSGSLGLSASMTAVNYTVPGILPVVAQPSSMSCWAASFTMLYSWKNQVSISIENALSQVGQKWVNIFQLNTGLPAAETGAFIRDAGLVSQPPMSLSVEGWEDLLRRYGPIMLTANETPGKNWAIHARILTGIKGDGTADGTRFTIIDPAGGRTYEESISTFLQKYEDEVIRSGYLRIQIVHWPAAANRRNGLSGSHSTAATAVNFLVKDVPGIVQPSSNTCWAAAVTMLFAWYRGNQQLGIRSFLAELSDKSYVQLFDSNTAVSRDQEQRLYKLLGLATMDQFNPTIQAWEGYLREYGPLSVTIKYSNGQLVHAVVVTGIEGDGTAAGTRIHLIDPINDPAMRISSPISFDRFLELFERGAEWPMQIIHFVPGSRMVSTQASGNGTVEMEPIEITVSPERKAEILRRAGWKQGMLTATVLNFRGEPMLGFRLYAEFEAADVEPQTYAEDIRGGTAIFSRIWMKPSGTMRLMAVAIGGAQQATAAPSGVIHYALPANYQLRVEARQTSDDVQVTATSSAEAARKVGAEGTAGVNFEVFEIGGSVSTEESRTRGESRSRQYTVRIPTSTLEIKVL